MLFYLITIRLSDWTVLTRTFLRRDGSLQTAVVPEDADAIPGPSPKRS